MGSTFDTIRACVADISGHSGATQRRAAPRRGREDAPVETAGSDAHEAAILSGLRPACPATRLLTRAVGAEDRSRATVLERPAGASAGFEASERNRPPHVRHGADERDSAPRPISATATRGRIEVPQTGRVRFCPKQAVKFPIWELRIRPLCSGRHAGGPRPRTWTICQPALPTPCSPLPSNACSRCCSASQHAASSRRS